MLLAEAPPGATLPPAAPPLALPGLAAFAGRWQALARTET
jgi:hypothetical protein